MNKADVMPALFIRRARSLNGASFDGEFTAGRVARRS